MSDKTPWSLQVEMWLKAVLARIGLVFCEAPGCWEHETVHCRLHVWNEGSGGYVDEFDDNCITHASQYGYCWGCGEFWAGCESFDFNQMQLCPNCKDDPDYCDDWEDEEQEYIGEIDFDP